jgi:hypothetical protein
MIWYIEAELDTQPIDTVILPRIATNEIIICIISFAV